MFCEVKTYYFQLLEMLLLRMKLLEKLKLTRYGVFIDGFEVLSGTSGHLSFDFGI